MSAGRNGYSRYRARKLGIKSNKYGRDGGGKIMKKRRTGFTKMVNGVEVAVDGPAGKKYQGWADSPLDKSCASSPTQEAKP